MRHLARLRMSFARGARAIGATLWVLSSLTGYAEAEVPPEMLGRPVREVRFVTPVSVDEADFRKELLVTSNAPLTEEAIRKSLEWLRAKETFSSVDVDVVEQDGGASIRFILVPADVIVGVEVRGAEKVSETDVRRRARIREDELLSETKIAAATDRLQRLYVDRGYRDATITVRPKRKSPGRVVVQIRIGEGEPIRIGEIEIAGLPEGLGGEATELLGFTEGAPFAADQPRRGREALTRFLRNRSYYEADVREAHEVDDKTASLWFEARPGPPFDVAIDGNENVARERLLGLTDLATRPIITNGTWRLLARRMQELYREEGYRFAEVEAEIEENGTKRVRFRVEEGPRVRVSEIRFRGVRGLSRREVLAAMETKGRSAIPLFGRGSWLREDVLAEDRDRVRKRYRSAGYLEAKVKDVRSDFSSDRRTVRLSIEIAEGPRSRVGHLRVEGAEGLLEDPERGLELVPGAAYDPERLEEDRGRLVSRLAALGHADADVATTVEPAPESESEIRIAVRHQLSPGPRIQVGKILIQQNYFTRDRVIRRELPFGSGDPFDPAKLVEAQRRLYRLGLFRSVSLQPVEAGSGVRDVLVRVIERPGGEVEYGFGYNTRSGLRNFAQIGHRNIMGTGRPATLRGELNLAPDNLVPDEWIVGLETKEPRLFGSRYDLSNNVVVQRSERSVDEFSIRRFSFSTGVEREFLPGLRASTLIEFEDSRIFDVAPDAVLTGQDVGELRTVSLNPILVYDGRDDAFAPTRGVFESLRLRYGTPALGSEVHFMKITAQHSQYVPVAKEWTFLYAGRAGLAEPLGSSEVIPLRERFFLGGRTSVRGFDENGIGPRGDQGNPVGGDLFFSGNSELRFPLLWGLGGAVFIDGGGLYLRDQGVSIGDFRESVGPGLRYLTPVGPISLDYGFKLDRRSGESIGEIHFTIGNIF